MLSALRALHTTLADDKNLSVSIKMAALLAVNRRARHRIGLQRNFKVRRGLRDLSEAELRDYRLPREEIEHLIRDFDASELRNRTNRGHAIPGETQVSFIYLHMQKLRGSRRENKFVSVSILWNVMTS